MGPCCRRWDDDFDILLNFSEKFKRLRQGGIWLWCPVEPQWKVQESHGGFIKVLISNLCNYQTMTVLTGHATSLNVSKLCVGSKPILFYKNPAKKNQDWCCHGNGHTFYSYCVSKKGLQMSFIIIFVWYTYNFR